jgi:hypothetical protein
MIAALFRWLSCADLAALHRADFGRDMRRPDLAASCSSVICRRWPLTSVRRAITNLTKANLLMQTGRSIIGPYGRRENV